MEWHGVASQARGGSIDPFGAFAIFTMTAQSAVAWGGRGKLVGLVVAAVPGV